jgi:hypothetical protein
MAYADKERERQELLCFLRAREFATGERLILKYESESPDFVCERADGTLVGVEHTKIDYNPERTEILEAAGMYDPWYDNIGLFWACAEAIKRKEAKRKKPHWKLAQATILVLDLLDRFRFEDWPTNDSIFDSLGSTGFLEIWISDHASIEDHGEVTAIGIFPKSIWGIRGQGYLWGPPR